MSLATEMKRHIDCNFLIKLAEDHFQCCDARGEMKNKKMRKKDAKKSSLRILPF